jgi:peptide-methionine (R)-S-oxide reductase
MHFRYITTLMFVALISSCNGQQKKAGHQDVATDTLQKVVKTENEWRAILTPEQYHVLRQKGTDRPFTGKYYKTTDDGVYHCAACGSELFTSKMKFDSECGWPSFDQAMAGGKIKTQPDNSHGMVRTEILCANCGGHLGHLFDDGPTKTGLRYCVNSTSLNFVKTTSPETKKQ